MCNRTSQRRKGDRKTFEEIITEIFPNLVGTIILPSKNLKEPQEETWGGKKKTIPRYIKVKILKTIKRAYTERNTVHFKDQDTSPKTTPDTGRWSNVLKILKKKKSISVTLYLFGSPFQIQRIKKDILIYKQ